jgi:hypothetical protein
LGRNLVEIGLVDLPKYGGGVVGAVFDGPVVYIALERRRNFL